MLHRRRSNKVVLHERLRSLVGADLTAAAQRARTPSGHCAVHTQMGAVLASRDLSRLEPKWRSLWLNARTAAQVTAAPATAAQASELRARGAHDGDGVRAPAPPAPPWWRAPAPQGSGHGEEGNANSAMVGRQAPKRNRQDTARTRAIAPHAQRVRPASQPAQTPQQRRAEAAATPAFSDDDDIWF